jgi:hypothetical protein
MQTRQNTKQYFHVLRFFWTKRWQIATLTLLPLMVVTTWGLVTTPPAVPPSNQQLKLNFAQIDLYDQGQAATKAASPVSRDGSATTAPSKGAAPTATPTTSSSAPAVPS